MSATRTGFNDVKKHCVRLAAILTVALSTGACSSVPDWVDPTTWMGDDTPTATDQSNGQTPDLAGLPDKPAASTPDEQREVSDQLASDRSQSHYSSDALRGGTEPSAPPPPAASPADQQIAMVEPTKAAPAPEAAPDAAPAPDNSAQSDSQAAPGPAPTTAVASAPEAAPVAPAPGGAQPAVPPGPATGYMATVQPSDAALGFKPSTAAPLDASVAQFVPQPIIARYQQTAAGAGVPGATAMASAAEPYRAPKLSRRHAPPTDVAMGGPENMSGAVVANLDALQPPANTQANVYANSQGLPPTAVVFFPGDGTLLNAAGKAQVRAAVEAFQAHGGQGFIRVVGHSSSRTSNMPVEKHLVVIFEKSQDRANAVAQEVIREGIPASHVLVEAVGDSQPVYYESMPKGEDGNRRAEIFIQG
jgi:outer membrane protein OmpA-like peptidoglycan-associated protein